MDIRKADIDDAEAIFDLANQIHEAMSVYKADFLLMFNQILQRQDSICLLGEDGSEIVAYISGCVHPVLIHGAYTAYVDEIVVLPDRQGKGIGSVLMAEMERWAKGQRCSLIALATGGASGFYEPLGYSSRAAYYKTYL